MQQSWGLVHEETEAQRGTDNLPMLTVHQDHLTPAPVYFGRFGAATSPDGPLS